MDTSYIRINVRITTYEAKFYAPMLPEYSVMPPYNSHFSIGAAIGDNAEEALANLKEQLGGAWPANETEIRELVFDHPPNA